MQILTLAGIPGLVVAFLMYMLLAFGTSAQKQEFINKYILFNQPYSFNNVTIPIILFFSFTLLAQRTYYKRIIKIEKDQNKRLTMIESSKISNSNKDSSLS